MNGEMYYDGGFITGKKNQDENLDFPSKPGAGGGINRVSDSVIFIYFFALAGESTFSEAGVARRFPGYGYFELVSFLAFRSCLVFWGRIFCCMCRFSDCNF
jgi:hypothetical protein